MKTLRCEVVEVSRDEAIILMVDSNAQRSVILPCDKGRAFKMKLEALKRQGQRTDLTSTPAACRLKGETADIVGKQAGESGDQVRRFIRLTYLIKELQDFVDKGQMKMRPAVELSYLDEETQRDIVDRSGDDTGNGLNMQTVISDMNAEYQAKINETKGTVAYDVLEMSGTRAVWPEVLSVYAVKTAGDPNNPQEVATIDESKRQILKEIFWAMNEISFSTATKTESVITETDDGNGNIVETTESMTRTYLYIRVSHKSPDEMAAQYGFTDTQKEQLRELLSEENKNMWSGVLYRYKSGGEDIVSVALSQIGNVGGEPYWSWYGFNSRVEWCAAFVSWCADQCGYIETGVCPKFAGVTNGVKWFKDRNQWADASIEPSPGMIIFFDWNNQGGSGPQDGSPDHTGIVEKVENGYVYTVEGNTGDSCAERRYSVGHYEILGYGLLFP